MEPGEQVTSAKSGSNEGRQPRRRIGKGCLFSLAVIVVVVAAFLKVGSQFAGARFYSMLDGNTRLIASATENYRAEHGAWPRWSADPSDSIYHGLPEEERAALKNLPTFAKDTIKWPFQDSEGNPSFSGFYCYWSNERYALIWNCAKDGKFDLTMDNVPGLLDPSRGDPAAALAAFKHDTQSLWARKGDSYVLLDAESKERK